MIVRPAWPTWPGDWLTWSSPCISPCLPSPATTTPSSPRTASLESGDFSKENPSHDLTGSSSNGNTRTSLLKVISGKVSLSDLFYSDIWMRSKFDVLDVFHRTELKYFTTTDGKKAMRHDVFELTDISGMMIETRPTYPSDRLTFNQANITRAQSIRYLNIFCHLNNQFTVNVILEDSKRNFLNSIIRQ